MRRLCLAITAIFLACGLAACATVSTTALEPQSKQRDARLARLYFIWPRSAMFRTATFDINVDGQVVGKIAPDSYFFIDRQPGTYALKVEPPFDGPISKPMCRSQPEGRITTRSTSSRHTPRLPASES